MCGRVTLASSGDVVAEVFGLTAVPPLRPRYNIAPTQDVPTVRLDERDGTRRLVNTRWGLIPFGTVDPARNPLINARAESLADRPAFRFAFRKRRCLVVLDGFYEWQGTGKARQPYLVRMRGGLPFALAGLWDVWRDPQGGKLETCVIVTTAANRLIQPIHDRMPVVLTREAFALWLDPGVSEREKLEPLLRPREDLGLETTRVSAHVNDPRNDDARCILPEPVLL